MPGTAKICSPCGNAIFGPVEVVEISRRGGGASSFSQALLCADCGPLLCQWLDSRGQALPFRDPHLIAISR
jgi:hypothetical protein